MLPLLILGGGAFIGSAAALYRSMDPMVPSSSSRPSTAAPQTQYQKYADATGEWRPESGKPADARLVPILPATKVMLPGTTVMYWYASKPALLAALNSLRQVLAGVGRGDEDPRAVMCRAAIETAWGRRCQQNAWGNVKKRPWTSRTRILVDHQVWTDVPESIGVHLLVDNIGSFDSYSSFASASDYFRYQARFLDRNYGTNANIAGARVGYRQGGVEGTVASERRLQWGAGDSNEPYAGSSAVPRAARLLAAERQARSFWSLCSNKAGAEWVRG